MLSISDIKKHSFAYQKGGKFYESVEVDSFFENVTETLDTLTAAYEKAKRENDELVKKISVLSGKIEDYRKDEDNIRSALLIAQRAAESVIKDAKEEAETIVVSARDEANEKMNSTDVYIKEKKKEIDSYLTRVKTDYDDAISEAEEKAEAIVSGAKTKAQDILTKAQYQADSIVSSIQNTISINRKKINSMKKITSEFKTSVIDVMKQQIRLLESIEVEGIDAEEFVFEAPEYDEVYHPEYTSEEYNDTAKEEAKEPVTLPAEEEKPEETEVFFEAGASEDFFEADETVPEMAVTETEKEETFEDIVEDEPEDTVDEDDIKETTEIVDFEDIENIVNDFEDAAASEAEAEAEPEAEVATEEDGKAEEEADDYFSTIMDDISSSEEKRDTKSVFTPIGDPSDRFYRRTEEIVNGDRGDEDLRFGKDYDIFDEEDDAQGSFFGRFKKK